MHIGKTGTRVLLVLCAVAMAGVASGQVVSLDPADSAIPAAGETVALTIAVADIQDLFGWQVDVAFDSSVLSFASFAEGEFLKGAGATFPIPSTEAELTGDADGLDRVVTVGATSLAGATDGSGELGTATFDVAAQSATLVKLINPIFLDSAVAELAVETAGATLSAGAPVADAGADMTADAGATVSFDGSGSTDDGTIESYEWDFDDGSTGTGVTATHIYDAAGTYNVTLTVTDDGGLTATDSAEVVVAALAATITEHTAGSDILRLEAGLPEAGTAASAYIAISLDEIAVEAGQFLEYQVAMFSRNPTYQVGVDVRTSAGSSLADAVDADGVSAAASADLSSVARNQWHHRQISLDSLAGETISEIALAVDTSEHSGGLFRAYFDNIQITDGTSRLTDVYIDGATVPLPDPVAIATEAGSGGISGATDASVEAGVVTVSVDPKGKLLTNWADIKGQ